MRYEDLKADKLKEAFRMLDFLHQDYNRTAVAQRLEDGLGMFHRQHSTADDYNHYTEDQRGYIKSVVISTVEKLQNSDNEQLHLLEYLN